MGKSSEEAGNEAIFRVLKVGYEIAVWMLFHNGNQFLSLDTEVLRAWENDSSLLKGMERNIVVRETQWLRQKEAKERYWISPNISVVSQKRLPQTMKYCLVIPLGIRPKYKQHFEQG